MRDAGMISCKLLRTVISLTNSRKLYDDKVGQLSLVNRTLVDELEPTLTNLFQSDAQQFARVIAARNSRDKAIDKKEERKFVAKERRELKEATEIPLAIARNCISLAEHSLVIFDLGYKSARGDSCVAASASIAAAIGALSIVYLNLRKFDDGEWALKCRAQADKLMPLALKLQGQLLNRISVLNGKDQMSSLVTLN